MSYCSEFTRRSAEHGARLESALNKFRDALAIGDRLAIEAMAYARDDVHFAWWVDSINRRPMRAYGLTVWDMPDHLWRDLFDDGLSPAEAWNDFLLANEDEFNLEIGV